MTERFLIRIPAHADLPATAPLLNAGVAAYSAMQHWKLEAGQRVGVIGMGGLGHIAVMLAAARGARVTVFTTSSHKLRDAVLFGAEQAILWNDELAFERLAGTFDLLISTVPQGYCVGDFMALLKLDGTLVNLGTTADLQHAVGAGVPRGRQSVATSRGGSITDTQSVVDYCVAHGIRPRIELIRADAVQRMIERTPDIEVRYRYVIDFASARHH